MSGFRTKTLFNGFGQGKRQRDFEQVAVNGYFHFAVLEFDKAFGDGKTQPVALRVARSVGADETFRKFFAVDVERAFGDVAESYAGGVAVPCDIEINARAVFGVFADIGHKIVEHAEQSARVGKDVNGFGRQTYNGFQFGGRETVAVFARDLIDEC